MKHLAPLAALALFAAPVAAHAQDIDAAGAIGTWEGVLEIPGNQLRFVIQLTDEDKDGTLEAMAYSPDQGGGGLPVSGVALSDDVLTINIPEVAASYEGTYNGEAFVGTFKQGPGELPLTLERSDWTPESEAASAPDD
ncbi:hypothetical protein WJS89_12200 [Sphingomicrobium sp. XHP0235]|uniref:hypothetical protein n=1 Tax=Sphingomicrobium aquimarinum TaxID=3133971 RepID=UPI0031FE65B1